MKEPIKKSIHSEIGKIELFELGQTVDDIFTVILCPICENKTLDNHYICRHCGWEYDGFPDRHYSAANGATLAEYREQYYQADKGGNTDEI